MQIECIPKRNGGSRIDIDGVEYHFAPQADGAHVATVDDDGHAQRFLGIKEGYKIYRGAKPVEPSAPVIGELDGDGGNDEVDERAAMIALAEATEKAAAQPKKAKGAK